MEHARFLTDKFLDVGKKCDDVVARDSFNLINPFGPESNNASNFWNAVLNNDETWIAASSGNAQQQSIYSNDMNINNTKASQTSTGYNNILSGLAQQTSSMTSNYGNLSQLANTVVTGLASAINQDWVI